METNGGFVKSLVSVEVSVIICTIAVIGVIGNIFVIVIVFKHTKLWQQLTCKYVVNQSFIDAATLIVVVLRVAVVPGDAELLTGLDDLGADVYCRTWGSPLLLYGLLLSSTYNLVAISIERYIGIVHPLWHKMSLTPQKVSLSIVTIWLFGICYIACVVGATSTVSNGKCHPVSNWSSQGVQKLVAAITLCVSLVLPVLVHGFCYGRIIVSLRQRIQPEVTETAATPKVWTTSTTPSEDRILATRGITTSITSAEAGANSRVTLSHLNKALATRNVLKTLATVTAVFVVCWLPNKCYAFLYIVGITPNIGRAYYLTFALVILNCCVNPFIYIARFKAFREGVFITCRCQHCVP